MGRVGEGRREGGEDEERKKREGEEEEGGGQQAKDSGKEEKGKTIYHDNKDNGRASMLLSSYEDSFEPDVGDDDSSIANVHVGPIVYL